MEISGTETNLTKRVPSNDPSKDVDNNLEKRMILVDETEVKNQCPYASTIKRFLLDFDYEKSCSVSLTKTNVYACLVCGKYY